jgi:hypothetical protein
MQAFARSKNAAVAKFCSAIEQAAQDQRATRLTSVPPHGRRGCPKTLARSW